MRDITEISAGVTFVLKALKDSNFTPDEKVAILRSAADTTQRGLNQEMNRKIQAAVVNNVVNNVTGKPPGGGTLQ